MQSRKTLLIVYHSMTSGTYQMAQALLEGAARERQVNVRLLTAAEVAVSDVLNAEAYVFATPENLASMSGQMKDFFDRTYYGVLDHVNGRPYAYLICAGSDGTGAAKQLERIATGWRLKRVADPLIVCTNAQTTEAILAPKHIRSEDLARCHDLGEAMATGLAMGIY